MPVYDSFLFKLPAPVAIVSLTNPKNGLKTSNVPMLLDTGADLTLIPKFAVEYLDLDFSQSSEIRLETLEGNVSVSQVLELQIIFANEIFQAKFPLIEQDYGVIGRNILNRFKIELDGQNLHWEIL
ncbi:MAG TPA: aspartyl protease family protein [Pyrinomonadaceae bacterium]|nr:aspartyl protease family protein [Pyrinomonadaceae bacterium]